MSEQRPLRPTPPMTPSAQMRLEAPVRPTPAPRPQRSKPDANPLRLLVGLAGIASASALVTAMLPSVSPTEVVVAADTTGLTAVAPEPSVLHVTRYVTLQPGQTAPPQSSVVIKPQPTPRVTVKVVKQVQVVTKQSGQP
ncbi:MAG: hypothetical protein ACYC65_10760 [Candidatus Limnocylindrales bacterium]